MESFVAAIAALYLEFPRRGVFSLEAGQSIKTAIKLHNVPNACGVYIITALLKAPEVIYIGKAGTIKRDGKSNKQKLPGRLTNKQAGIPRSHYFDLQIAKYKAGLKFEWFVTFDDDRLKHLPAFVEAQLLQVYFDDMGKLPELNKCV